MELSTTVNISPQVMARQVGDEIVILDLASGSYFGLDATGARMWQFMKEGQSISQLCDQIQAEFQVSREQVEKDAIKLIHDLKAHGLAAIG